MEKKFIEIKTAEEIEKITADTINLDSALFSHRKAISALIDILTSEKKAIDNAILDKVEHKKVKNTLFYTVISDYMDFNRKELEEKEPETFNKYKTLPVHREQVRTK